MQLLRCQIHKNSSDLNLLRQVYNQKWLFSIIHKFMSISANVAIKSLIYSRNQQVFKVPFTKFKSPELLYHIKQTFI